MIVVSIFKKRKKLSATVNLIRLIDRNPKILEELMDISYTVKIPKRFKLIVFSTSVSIDKHNKTYGWLTKQQYYLIKHGHKLTGQIVKYIGEWQKEQDNP